MSFTGRVTSIELAKRYVSENTNCELVSDEWVNSTTPMRFRCACGAEFTATFNKFRNDDRRKCHGCAVRDEYDAKRLTVEEISTRLYKKAGTQYISGTYQNQKSKLTFLCACGNVFTTTVNNAIYGKASGMCRSCGIRARARQQALTYEHVKEKAQEKGTELLSEEYENAFAPLRFRCPCGNEFVTSWNTFDSHNKTRCNECSGDESHGEYEVRKWLEAHGIAYEAEKRFPECRSNFRAYPFDFYLPEHNICIEFDGEHHFRPIAFGRREDEFEQVQKRDADKNAYCQANGIRLIRIPYWEKKNIDVILTALFA